MSTSQAVTTMAEHQLRDQCELLRSLHVPGDPLVLPNVWDVASARAVAEAGFPAVATSSGAVAAALGYEDHEGAPSEEMLAAAARIIRGVEVPVTVDAEAGYGMEPAELVAALREIGAAGCNLEDTDHSAGALKDPVEHAAWLRDVREVASARSYPLVINARIDVFLSAMLAGDERPQGELVSAGLERANAYVEAGADCVYPIALWEARGLREFISSAGAPVNVLANPQAPGGAELADLGAARISYGSLTHRHSMEQFKVTLASIAEGGSLPGID